MPLYIPWLTETIKKRGVRYLLHHYLGQFFEEKLTLEQLSIDIYEGKGSIRNLALDVDGLNDELDFIPFRFLDGCLIGQISVEVPWSSLATEACKVELDGAKFVCRLKTSADATKAHCTESTLLSRSLMTSSMQMAEEIVTTEDDDEYDTPESFTFKNSSTGKENLANAREKDANQMFEGLEMFAQLIDSVLRRTKLTARNTLFQIQPRRDDNDDSDQSEEDPESSTRTSQQQQRQNQASSRSSGDEFSEPIARSLTDDDDDDDDAKAFKNDQGNENSSKDTVEFFIKFFRCEEMVDQTKVETHETMNKSDGNIEELPKKSLGLMSETITKLLTLEDVEMRIGGVPVSNLIGKHTITIKFNGQKSEISIFSGSPLLAVISHKQLETFFNVFDSARDKDSESNLVSEKDQKIMSPEDYAKIENQLLETASLRTVHCMNELGGFAGVTGGVGGGNSSIASGPYYVSSQAGAGRRWVDSGDTYSNINRPRESDYDYHSPNSSSIAPCVESKVSCEIEATLDNIEAFSCELKLPGIWLCILRDGETLPPLIKPYADSINSFQTINKYIDDHIKVPHIRCLALKVALDITAAGTNIFLGDLDISEYLQDESMINPKLKLLHNDLANIPMSSSRYKASIVDGREITIDLLTKTRVMFDPTMIDRIVYDYRLIKLNQNQSNKKRKQPASKTPSTVSRNNNLDFNLIIRGEQFKFELLCPIPDLTPDAHLRRTQLRPQSFLFDFKDIVLTWQSDKLNVTSNELLAYVKTQPKQSDNEAIKFIESTGKNNDKIVLILEPSPSNLDTAFPNDVEQALNESSLYDSIYVSQATESRIPTEPFQIKRKVVRASFQSQQISNKPDSARISECDHEKILTPGDRQHLLDYLNQTVISTKLSLSLHLPICGVEFEDKEQLDLIYNRFGNDFVFWQPKAINELTGGRNDSGGFNIENKKGIHCRDSQNNKYPQFKQPKHLNQSSSDDDDDDSDDNYDDGGSEGSFHSSFGSGSDCYENAVTCKVVIDELFVKFNHQSCAAALKQEISADNLLLGVVIDVNKKPNTLLSLVADNLELSTDSDTVLEGNSFGDKNSTFSLTAEIKRPTKTLKNIKLALQLKNGLFNDLKTETYTRFWQSINVTDEPILGYVAPRIVTELHIDILSTALLIVKEGTRPALLSIDELYLTSMVMEQTSQVMIRLIADEVSLYLKRNKKGFEIMKNYICLIDSGLIDLDVKCSQDGRLEFGVINNVIAVRVCQDSLSALCKLFSVLVRNSSNNRTTNEQNASFDAKATGEPQANHHTDQSSAKSSYVNSNQSISSKSSFSLDEDAPTMDHESRSDHNREMNLLVDAMNDFSSTPNTSNDTRDDSGATDRYTTAYESDNSNSGSDDGPLAVQRTSTTTTGQQQRSPKVCLLDESNPMIGDLFSEPLLPLSEERMNESIESGLTTTDGNKALGESGFFVIGDDDVGAGIIDKQQHEPVVRKLIDGPINIVENHFKMTKPRTIPEMLASSLERYVLEEMTLVVNLYGGRDFDDEDPSEDSNSTNAASEATDQDAELVDTTSVDSLSIRSRAGSVANRKHCLSDSNSSSLKRKGGRRKHLSEGSSKDIAGNSKDRHSLMEPRVRFGEGAVNLWESLDLMSSPDFLGTRPRPSHPPMNSDSKQAGGTWRQTDVCIQLTLNKVKLLYERADPTAAAATTTTTTTNSSKPPISWRFMLFIHDIEVKDRVAASDINKMLYEYCTESMPKRSTQFLIIKNIATINPTDGCEECDLRVSLKPLRLNIDQDTLIFLIEFFTTLYKSLTKQQSIYSTASNPVPGTSGGGLGRTTSVGTNSGLSSKAHDAHVTGRSKDSLNTFKKASNSSTTDGINLNEPPFQQKRDELNDVSLTTSSSSIASSSLSAPNSNRIASNGGGSRGGDITSSGNEASATTATITTTRPALDGNPNTLPTHCHTDNVSGPANQHPIYIKSFTFSPDVPIRLDYHAKHLDFEQGALAGILMGLAHLDHSELVLRRVQAKHGMRGLDRVLLFALNSWLSDIKRNQLPSILSGVGPMHSVIQLFQGMRDLIWMPIDHYRKDKRLVRGLQRGASSFSSSTAMAAINLVNRFISIVQCTAQIAHDIVTPPTGAAGYRRHRIKPLGVGQSTSSSMRRRHHHHHHHHHHSSHRQANASGCTSTGSSGLDSNSSIIGLNQPRNFCEGVAVGFTILKEGFNDTARNVTVGMQAEDMRSAVGELVRQIPSTLLNPIISATEGAQSVLVGIRNQIAPDARREDQEKWKRRMRGK